MPMPSREQTQDFLIDVGPWPDGVVNARPGKDLPKSALQDAVNVDLSDAGTARRRKGSTLAVGVSASGSSCWADDFGIYFLDGDQIKRATLNAGVWTTTVLRGGMFPGRRVWWTSAQGATWFSNGSQKGRIVGGRLASFGLEIPAGQPSLSVSSGNLDAGIYAVALTFVSASGEESGTQSRVLVEIPKGSTGSIVVSSIPKPKTAEIVAIRVYVTEANGTVLYRYRDMPAGTGMFIVSKATDKGMTLATENTDEFPACEQIHAWRGFMLGIRGRELWRSEAMRFGLAQLGENFTLFADDILMLAPVQDGVYVVTAGDHGKTYFLSGTDPDKWERQEVLPYGGAVPGTFVRIDDGMRVAWASDRGEIRAGPQGEIKNVTREKFAPAKYSQGAALFRREDGIEQIVNTFLKGGEAQVMGASSFTDAEIIRAQPS